MILPKQPLECIDFQGFIDSVSVDEPLIWSQRQARQSRFYPRPANSSVLPSFLSFLILFILLFSASKCGCVQAAFFAYALRGIGRLVFLRAFSLSCLARQALTVWAAATSDACPRWAYRMVVLGSPCPSSFCTS